jgi:hypothetical protein
MVNRIKIYRSVIMMLLCISFSLVSWAIHPIKISTSIISYSSEEVSVTMYFFADDFGAHLKTIYGDDFSLETSQPTTIRDVQDYIKKHYVLKVNNEVVKLVKQNNSLADNVFQISFKAKRKVVYVEGKTEVNLKNTLLLEAFKDQSNIVRIDFKGDGNYETLEFEKGNEVQKIKI